MTKYQSSVMRFTGCEDDGCEMCKFIVHGDTSTKVLLHVIENLDASLTAREEMCKLLTKALMNITEDSKKQ